jgi:hypothetical protein
MRGARSHRYQEEKVKQKTPLIAYLPHSRKILDRYSHQLTGKR